MINNEALLDFGQIEDRSKGIIKVIGVGGGGCNAVRNMGAPRFFRGTLLP